MQMNQLFKTSAIALMLGASAVAFAAGVRTQTVEAIGTGITRSAAINAALVEAVSRVSGVSVSAKDASSMAAASVTTSADDKEQTRGIAYEAAMRQVQMETGGFVRGYQILSIDTEPQTQLMRAKLSVDVNYFEKGRATSRMRIAVLPFKLAASNVSPADSQQFVLNVNQAAVNYLTSTRHFAIVDRDFEADRNQELARLLNPDVPREERARLGNTLATDYILTGRVLEFSAANQMAKDPYTGETTQTIKGQVSVQWRLIEAATGQISVAGSVTLPIKTKAAVTGNGNLIGRDIGEQINETIYPIAALGFENGELIVAQGGETIKPGDIYSLMRQGSIRKDPYTGEQMGRNETSVGEVRITRVTPKMSYAQIVKCSVELKNMAPREYLLRKVDGAVSSGSGSVRTLPTATPVAQPAW